MKNASTKRIAKILATITMLTILNPNQHMFAEYKKNTKQETSNSKKMIKDSSDSFTEVFYIGAAAVCGIVSGLLLDQFVLRKGSSNQISNLAATIPSTQAANSSTQAGTQSFEVFERLEEILADENHLVLQGLKKVFTDYNDSVKNDADKLKMILGLGRVHNLGDSLLTVLCVKVKSNNSLEQKDLGMVKVFSGFVNDVVGILASSDEFENIVKTNNSDFNKIESLGNEVHEVIEFLKKRMMLISNIREKFYVKIFAWFVPKSRTPAPNK